MKILKWFILVASMIAFITCSKNQPETFDGEVPLEAQSRGVSSQNDSAEGGGMGATIVPRDTLTVDIVANEVPKDEVKNDSIPNDSIQDDSKKKE